MVERVEAFHVRLIDVDIQMDKAEFLVVAERRQRIRKETGDEFAIDIKRVEKPHQTAGHIRGHTKLLFDSFEFATSAHVALFDLVLGKAFKAVKTVQQLS